MTFTFLSTHLPSMSHRCRACGLPRSLHYPSPLHLPKCNERSYFPGRTTSDIKPLYPHRSQDFYRIDTDKRTVGNVREKVFAECWAKQQQQTPSFSGILSILMGREPTDSEFVAAATAIQWLGTNLGQGWLEEVQKLCKKETEELRQKEAAERAAKDG